jgi:hypothetical protein
MQRKARRKEAPQAEEDLENPEVTPLHTPRTPAQKSASKPARVARKRLREEAWRNSFKGLEVIYTNNARFEKFVMSCKRMTRMDGGGGRSFKFVSLKFVSIGKSF